MNKLAKSKVILTALLGVSLTAGLLATPAKAVETINLTIWTFGEVIQPGLQREYQKLHPEIKIIPIKNDVEEAKVQNELLADLLQVNPIAVLGEQYQRFEQVILILADISK